MEDEMDAVLDQMMEMAEKITDSRNWWNTPAGDLAALVLRYRDLAMKEVVQVVMSPGTKIVVDETRALDAQLADIITSKKD